MDCVYSPFYWNFCIIIDIKRSLKQLTGSSLVSCKTKPKLQMTHIPLLMPIKETNDV